MLAIAIWDRVDKVVTRTVDLSMGKKELKMNGRKPNRFIVPESIDNEPKLLKLVKSLGTYDCKIVKATNR